MPILTLDATLTEAPVPCSDPGGFPSTSTTIPFELNPPSKSVVVSTGRKLVTVSSPSAFVTLLGATGDTSVNQAGTVYMRVSSGAFQARLTFANAAAPSSPIVSILPIAGVLCLEPDAGTGYACTKVEVQGSGIVEFYASGLQ